MAKKEILSQPFNLRLTPTLRSKCEYISGKGRRKVSEWGRLVVEDAVAAYEAQHGAIVLPPLVAVKAG